MRTRLTRRITPAVLSAGLAMGAVLAVGGLAYAVGAEPGWTQRGTRGTVEQADGLGHDCPFGSHTPATPGPGDAGANA